jgi:energy-coupling factor transporter ATP-binding protein EcfA2
MITIDEVDVKCLRGITSSNLALNGKWLYLLGENGTGKSSFIDALEYLFTSNVQHLRGIQAVSIVKHLHHVDRRADNMSVTVRFTGSPLCEISRNGSGLLSPVPEQLKEYFSSASPGTFILRRDQLLRFVCSDPADRFKALDAFIGIGSLDDIELNMKRARDELQGQTTELGRQHSELLGKMGIELDATVVDEAGALAQMNALLTAAGVPAITSFTDQSGAADSLRLRAKKAALGEKEIALDLGIQAAAAALKSDLGLRAKIGAIERVRALLSTDKSREKSKYVALFKSAQLLLPGELAKEIPCPLCDQNTDSRKLLSRINGYLDDNLAATNNAQTLRVESAEVSELLKTQATRIEELAVLLDREPNSAGIASIARRLGQQIQSLRQVLANVERLNKPLDMPEFIKIENQLLGLSQSVLRAVKDRIDGVALSPEDKVAKELEAKLTTVSLFVRQMKAVDTELGTAQEQSHVADTVYECFKLAKQAVVQGVFDRLQHNVSAWYARLHPGDEHGNVSLGVDPGQRASAKLLIESFGQTGQDPRAYSSEGHLDSLGLVIFLAFAKEFQGACNLLVLDDVVSSVDTQHRQRICGLLSDEFTDWQLIVTTHDQMWFEQLWQNAVASDRTGKVSRQSIVRWSRALGPIVMPYLSGRERIEEYLGQGDKDAAGFLARIYLESVLKATGEAIGTLVRYKKNDKYMIGELRNAANSRLGSMTEGPLKAALKLALDGLREWSFMANILAHDNETLDPFSLDEVTGFCRAVEALEDALVCPVCGYAGLYYDDIHSSIMCSHRGCSQSGVT